VKRSANRRTLIQLLTGLAVVALLLVGCDGTSASSQSVAFEKAVDEFITPYVDAKTFSGSVLIAEGENVLISKGYGMANLEHDVPNTPQTKFRLGSITKQFTAMAILMLQEQGQLDVQDPVCDYIPDCPEAWQAITIHHLLTHSSGIPNYTGFPDFKELAVLGSTISGTIDTFRDKPLGFAPGTAFGYSNSGYILLSHIIEQSAGNPSYEAFVSENIFQPLNMMNSGVDQNSLVLSNRASGYVRVDSNTLANADYLDMSVPHAALYSTVEDLYLWDRALYTETLVSQNSLDMMFTPDKGYGYGWFISYMLGRKVAAHDGGINGFATFIARFVDDDVVIIVLSNIENSNPENITRGLARIVFRED